MGSPNGFSKLWLVTVAGLAIMVAALNLLVDPYDVFGTPRIDGISRLKPGPKNHALLAKTYQVARARPLTVLIGSSSTHIGIDAAAPQWPDAMQPVYNYGIPGGYATSTSLHTLREAIGTGGVKNAVVFLDFQNFFNPEHPASELTEDDRRYHTLPDGGRNPNRAMQVANDMFLSMATMGALMDSVSTILGQRDPGLLNLAANGSSTEADFSNAAHADGMYDLFFQKDDYEAERALRLKRVMAGWSGNLPNLGILEAMITLARENNVALTFVLTPHHADALEIYWRNGLWQRIEQLKIEIAELVARQNGAVAFWDFMDYSPFNTEVIPASGDRRTPTSWFWEPTHFKKQLGEVMIQRMFGQDAPAFGTRLTPQNVSVSNELVRSQRQARVCEKPGEALLTALTKPIASGCAQTITARGPT